MHASTLGLAKMQTLVPPASTEPLTHAGSPQELVFGRCTSCLSGWQLGPPLAPVTDRTHSVLTPGADTKSSHTQLSPVAGT